MNMNKNYAIHSGWLIPTIKSVSYIDLEFKDVLERCQLDQKSLTKNEELCIDSMCKIMDYCNDLTGRRDFAITIAKHFHIGMFHALGYAMMSSDSIAEAFKRLVRYKKLVSNTTDIMLTKTDTSRTFILKKLVYPDTQRPMLSDDWAICFLATIVQFCRQASLDGISPLRITLDWPKPNFDTRFLDEFFKCEILFDQPDITIEFARKDIDQTLLSRNPFLVLSHDKLLDEYISDIQKTDIVKESKRYIRELLPLGTPSQICIAKKMGISLRSLQRKLQSQETTYRDLLEETRRELALNYISQNNVSFCEIGYLVGFSSTSNFNRAFKRWTDLTPSCFRRQLTQH